MKPLLVLGKIFLIACLWSLFFIEGIRVILLINWHFDIFWPPHWVYLWQLWHSGWVIDHAKEWAFILILLAAVPMWLTGWIFLSVINWSKLFDFILFNPIRRLKAYINDINAPARNDLAVKRVVKKKSYKEIRPNLQGSMPSVPYENHPVSVVIKDEDEGSKTSYEKPAGTSRPARTTSAKTSTEEKKPFTHSVFDFDDDDDDFDLDFDYAVKSIREKQKESQADDDIEDDEDYEGSKKSSKSSRGRAFDDFENDIRDEELEDDENEDSDDDYEEEAPAKSSRQKRQSRDEIDDDDDDFDRPQKRERSRNSERKESRRDRDENARQTKKESSRHQSESRKSDQPHKNEAGNPIVDTLRQKGYEIISGVNIKNTYIDYVAVDANSLYLCLVDKEVGDWLADEERFNDEEPLWFSETNHRVSPVRMVDIARNILAKKLKSCKITLDLRAFVIIQNGNIINAEDMFEVWRGIDVDVTRINRGSPREIPLFSKSIEEVSHRIDSLRFESLKKLIRSLG